jgi:2,4-didehydro-3-deoxy-L-rhamnonate hydrolase
MKLIRFGDLGRERPGLQLDNGKRKDLSEAVKDFDHAFFADAGIERLRAWLRDRDVSRLPDVNAGARMGAPIARPGKILAIGLNYRDHAAESGAQVPSEPILFSKAVTSFSGPNDPIQIPPDSVKTDYEIELGIVIGQTVRRLSDHTAARAAIAGVVLVNDVSERHWQLERGGQWDKGKGFDSFCPVGPWLVTLDEVDLNQARRLVTRVNGRKRQSSMTDQMIFSPDEIVRYVSQVMTLEAGDLICTGTPAGVGMGMKPPLYLAKGDVVELEIDGLGRQRQVCELVLD